MNTSFSRACLCLVLAAGAFAGSAQAGSAPPTTVPGDSALATAAQRLLTDTQSSVPASNPLRSALVSTAATVVANLSRTVGPLLCVTEALLVNLRAGVDVMGLGNALDADIINLQVLILSQPGASACGGVTGAPQPVTIPVAQVVSADNTQVTLHIVFPTPTFVTKQGDGKTYLEMFEQGFGNGGSPDIGNPELPVTGMEVAVPIGATASVQVLGTTSYQLQNVLLWPVQPAAPAVRGGNPAFDQAPPPPLPFTVNSAAYQSTAVTPRALGSTGDVGSMRGLPLSTLSLAGATYKASARQLTVLQTMDVKIRFGGDNSGVFGTAELAGPWNMGFTNLFQSTIVNWGSVAQNLGAVPAPVAACGEEMMVITGNSIKPVAEAFAADRTAHGVLAKVFLVEFIAPEKFSTTKIWNLIHDEYSNTQCIRPSYVTLFDSPQSLPTYELSLGYHKIKGPIKGQLIPEANFFENPVASDMPYGFMHQGAELHSGDGDLSDVDVLNGDFHQDIFVGRIAIPYEGAAGPFMNSISNYDNYPDAFDPSYFQKLTAVAYFQPCEHFGCQYTKPAPPIAPPGTEPTVVNETPSITDTWSFLRASEFAASQAEFAGKTVNRVLSDDREEVRPSATIAPTYYDDGAPIRSGLHFESLIADDQTKIRNDVESGTFLVWHSDHGNVDGSGWFLPYFRIGDVDALQNNIFGGPTVVWSSDCDSGKYDKRNYPNVRNASDPAFGTEWLVSGKAVAFVGASRESPIYQDGLMLEGMASSLFPEIGNLYRKADGAPPVAPVVEVGPLLSAAKSYMSQKTNNLATDTGSIGTVLEYNILGDPSTVVRRDKPVAYDLSQIHASIHSGVLTVSTTQPGTNGGVVTILQDGQYVGRGVLKNGVATIQGTSSFNVLNLYNLDAILAGDGFVPNHLSLGSRSIGTGG